MRRKLKRSIAIMLSIIMSVSCMGSPTQAYAEGNTSRDFNEDLVYFVNAGDIDPSTVNEGDRLGIYNSVTEQFFGEDPETGKEWGLVDTYVSQNITGYPNGSLLTGQYTWPCENGPNGNSNPRFADDSPSEYTFRYAKNQARWPGTGGTAENPTVYGIPYKFEMENGVYTVKVTMATWAHQPARDRYNVVLNKGKDTEVAQTNITPASVVAVIAGTSELAVSEQTVEVTDGWLTLNIDFANNGAEPNATTGGPANNGNTGCVALNQIYIMKNTDMVTAEEVMDLIAAIGEVSYTPASKAKIDAAREAYDELTEEQKELVTNYGTLTDAEATYRELAGGGSGASGLVYFVNAGDIDPTTVNEGDRLGTHNSVTEQFFGEDPETGKEWGLVDTYVSQNITGYPNGSLLTGQYTWPCENGPNGNSNPRFADDSPSEYTFRYAKNQARWPGTGGTAESPTVYGIPYKFEMENGVYTVKVTMATWAHQPARDRYNVVLNKGKDTESAQTNITPASVVAVIAGTSEPAVSEQTVEVTDGWLTLNIDFANNGAEPHGTTGGPANNGNTSCAVVNQIYIMNSADAAAAEEVMNLIEEIGEVSYTPESKAKIDAAREAYNELAEEQRELVTNYGTLTAAETTYQTLANPATAEEVMSLIAAIGEVFYTPASKAKIDAAREAYDELTEEQKELVTNYGTLMDAEATYRELAGGGSGASGLVYFVNAGDIDPTTVNEGDRLGTHNSVTEQFFGVDPGTGKEWGVVDPYVQNSTYPNLLTGQYTWPAENLNYTDTTSSNTTYRYAKNQTSGVNSYGIPYKFEIENGQYIVKVTMATGWPNQVGRDSYNVVLNKGKATEVSQKNIPTSGDPANPAVSQQEVEVADGWLTLNIDYANDNTRCSVVNQIYIWGINEGDDEAAANVTSLIAAIGEVSYTEVSKEKIDAARSAYDDLTDVGKTLVTNYKILTDAESRYKTLKGVAENAAAAEEVMELIAAIGEVSYTESCKEKVDAARSKYNGLTTVQKGLVTNYNVLTSAEATYRLMKIADDNEKAAGIVMDLITAIGEVTYTESSKEKIDAAREAYEELSYVQQGLVTNYDKLIAAEEAYRFSGKAQTDKKAAEPVIKLIGEIGTVTYTSSSKRKIDAARFAYEALTEAQKKFVTNYEKLTAAETTYKTLEARNREKPLPAKNSVHTVNNLKYKVLVSSKTKGTVTVVKAMRKTLINVTIPARITINGYNFKVTQISDRAFYKNTKLTRVIIGSNVTKIGSKAFYGDKKLKNVKITSKVLKNIGKKAFKNTSKYLKIKVPAKQLKVYKNRLKNKGLSKTAKITK